MRTTTQRLCVWAGPVMVVIWGAGFLVAGFFPLPAPSAGAAQVAAMYSEHRTAIRVGLALTIACSGLLAPFIGMISVQMKRIEGASSPLTYAQTALGALLIIEFVYPMMILQVAAYRDDRPAETVQAIHDLGWMLFVGVVCTAIMQLIVIGVAIFSDDRDTPIFPRWAGYLNLWVALLITASSLIPFFKTGPFAWNGLLSWWIAASAFAFWLFVMTHLLLRAISRQEGEVATVPAGREVPADGEFASRRQVEALAAQVEALQAQLRGDTTLAESASG